MGGLHAEGSLIASDNLELRALKCIAPSELLETI